MSNNCLTQIWENYYYMSTCPIVAVYSHVTNIKHVFIADYQ